MFEISQIRCFVAVVEELHFSRAAERLNMTQPPLSRQIRLLEHQVGVQLIEHGSHGVELTAAGKAFFPEAARILRMAEEAVVTARRVGKSDRGTLTIGFTASFGYGLLPELVRRLRERVPGVALTLKELVTSAQLEMLFNGQIDLGLLRPHAQHSELECVLLATDALMLAVPSQEAGQWPEKPALDCLNGKPFIMYSPHESSYFSKLLDLCFDQAGVEPDVVQHVGQIHTMLALVRSGIGAALIPGAATNLNFDGIVVRRVATHPAEPVQIACSYRRDNTNAILGIFKRDILYSFRPGAACGF
jgi:DNA-binding transcriptional LysR family regulator